jgi:acyl carrier protein
MTQAEAETAVVAILRRGVLLNSDREVDVDAPMGASGLGLDSLALAELLVAVEEELGVELPQEAWAASAQLTPRRLARLATGDSATT